MNMTDLEGKTKEELVSLAKEKGIPSPATLKKQDIIQRLMQTQAEPPSQNQNQSQSQNQGQNNDNLHCSGGH